MESLFSTCSYCVPEGCYSGECPFREDSNDDRSVNQVVSDVLAATGSYDHAKLSVIDWGSLTTLEVKRALEMCSFTTTSSDN